MLVCRAIWRVLPAGAGFARVYVSEGSLLDSCAISASLFCIVMTSVLTGTVLPFGLAFMGVDPANAGTTIQVSRGLSLACLLFALAFQGHMQLLYPVCKPTKNARMVRVTSEGQLPVQVWCDITGCLITCVTCKLILDQLAHVLPLGS